MECYNLLNLRMVVFERVRITDDAGNQIREHPEILNEEFVVALVLSVPRSKRDYYQPDRFAIRANRRDRRGNWKTVLVRVAEINTLMNVEYVVLLVHVEYRN